MARAIDQKITQMKLDDSDFKSKVRTTLDSFAQLTKGMNKIDSTDVSGPAKGLNAIANASEGTDKALLGMQSAIESLSNRFTILGQVAQGVIFNITQRVTDMAGRVIKGATIQPLIDGYNEYANKLKSINVIMNNVPGAKLGDVKSTLAELNTYADKTIYSFEDMTTNMGTFTAAGVGLKDSATAIQGIGNLAASSGSSTQQMSMAMYQLSQALASGKVGLQDWNSVVNAGMGGQKFQKALSETAKELGHGRNEAVSFRDSLQDGWLTSEVLLKTLNKFKNDKSMEEAATQVKTFRDLIDTTAEGLGSAWAQVWENIIGDSSEAPKLWTGIANAIQKPIQAMDNYNKSTSKAFHDLGGRQAVINGLSNIFGNLGKVLGTVAKAFGDVFPPITAKNLVAMAKSFEAWTKTIKISDTDLQNLRKTMDGLLTIVKWVMNGFKLLGAVIAALIPDNLMSIILKVTAQLGDMIVSIDDGTFKMGRFGEMTDKAGKFISSFGSVIAASKIALGVFGNAIQALMPVVSKVGSFLQKSFQKMGDTLAAGLQSGQIDPNKIIAAGFGTAFIIYVRKLQQGIDGLTKIFKDGGPLKKVTGAAEETLGGLGKALSAFTGSVRVATLAEIALAMMGLAIALRVLASVPNKDVFKSLEMLAVMLFMMNKSLTVLGDMKGSTVRAIGAATAMIALATAVGILALSIKAFGKLDPGVFIQGMAGIAGTIMVMVAAMEVLSKQSPRSVVSAGALILLATAVDMIAVALAGLAQISSDKLINGVFAITIIVGALAAFIKVVDGAKFGPANALSIVAVALAIDMMTIPIMALGNMDFNKLATGLLALGAILVEIGVFAQIVSNVKMGAASVVLLTLSVAVGAMVIALAGLARISFKDLVKGLGALAIALVEMALAMDMAKGAISGAVAMTIMAAAINLLIPPLVVLSHLTFMQIVAGLTALAGVFVIIGLAGYALAPVVPALIGLGAAIALLGAGSALAGVGISLFATGLGALAAVSAGAVLGIGVTLNNLLDVMIKAGPKIGQLVVGWFNAILQTIAQQLPNILNTLGQLFLDILSAIDTYVPPILAKIIEIILDIVQVITDHIPEIVKVGSDFIIALAGAIGDNAQPVIDAGIKLIIDLINGMANGIRDNQEQIVDAVINAIEAILELVITALERVLDALFGWIPGFKGAASAAGDAARQGLQDTLGIDGVAADKGQKATQAIWDKQKAMQDAGAGVGRSGMQGMASQDFAGTGSKKGQEFVDGVGGKSGNAKGAGDALSNGANSGAGSANLHGTGSGKGQDFANGLGSKTGDTRSSGNALSDAAKHGAEKNDLRTTGNNAGSGFAAGIGDMINDVTASAESLARSAKDAIKKFLNIHSPSRVMREIGGYTGEGFALGIGDNEGGVVNTAKSLAQAAVDAMANAAGDIQAAMEDGMNLSPVITPVLDTSKFNSDDLNLASSVKMPTNAYGNNTASQTIVQKTEVTNNPSITIYQQPGESSEQLVNKIQKYLSEGNYA